MKIQLSVITFSLLFSSFKLFCQEPNISIKMGVHFSDKSESTKDYSQVVNDSYVYEYDANYRLFGFFADHLIGYKEYKGRTIVFVADKELNLIQIKSINQIAGAKDIKFLDAVKCENKIIFFLIARGEDMGKKERGIYCRSFDLTSFELSDSKLLSKNSSKSDQRFVDIKTSPNEKFISVVLEPDYFDDDMQFQLYLLDQNLNILFDNKQEEIEFKDYHYLLEATPTNEGIVYCLLNADPPGYPFMERSEYVSILKYDKTGLLSQKTITLEGKEVLNLNLIFENEKPNIYASWAIEKDISQIGISKLNLENLDEIPILTFNPEMWEPFYNYKNNLYPEDHVSFTNFAKAKHVSFPKVISVEKQGGSTSYVIAKSTPYKMPSKPGAHYSHPSHQSIFQGDIVVFQINENGGVTNSRKIERGNVSEKGIFVARQDDFIHSIYYNFNGEDGNMENVISPIWAFRLCVTTMDLRTGESWTKVLMELDKKADIWDVVKIQSLIQIENSVYGMINDNGKNKLIQIDLN